MSNVSPAWTDDAIADIRKMWRDGLSASTIGRKIGVTRNAVLGKLYRIGELKRTTCAPSNKARVRGGTGKSRAQRLRDKAAAMAALPPPKPAPAILDARPLHRPLLALKVGECRWPYGDRAPFTFCACKVEFGHWYCAAHLVQSVRQKHADSDSEKVAA